MHSDPILARINGDKPRLSRAFRLIAGFLNDQPGAFINTPMRALCDKIGVSEPTLLRFVRHYGFQGLPDFRLAFAMSLAAASPLTAAEFEPGLSDKTNVNRAAKSAIAARAAGLVDQDQVILLDGGSTVGLLTEHLTDKKPLTIVTPSLSAVLALRSAAQHKIILLGGSLRPGAMTTSGRMAEQALAGLGVDTVYLGADTIHPDYGLSTYSEEEAHLNRAMIRAARRVVVLVDASKFKAPALHHICPLSAVDTIICDHTLDPATRRAVQAAGPALLIADVPAKDMTDQSE